MVPGDLCKHLLHNCLILINLSKFSYILPITWRGALHLGNSAGDFASRSAPSHRRGLGAGAEAADPGAGGGFRASEGSPGDLLGHILPALVRSQGYSGQSLHNNSACSRTVSLFPKL